LLKKVVDLCLGLDDKTATECDRVAADNAPVEGGEISDHTTTQVQEQTSDGFEPEKGTQCLNDDQLMLSNAHQAARAKK
jgi:hypothetical protein